MAEDLKKIWRRLEENKEVITSLSEHMVDLEARVESLEAAIVASLKLFEVRKPKKGARRA